MDKYILNKDGSNSLVGYGTTVQTLTRALPWRAVDSVMRSTLSQKAFPGWNESSKVKKREEGDIIGVASYNCSYETFDFTSRGEDLAWYLHYELPEDITEAEKAELPSVKKTVLKIFRTHSSREIAAIESVQLALEPGETSQVQISNAMDQEALPDGGTVELLSIKLESMDRLLSGSLPNHIISQIGGDSKFGMVFRNTETGEEYRYNKLEAAHIYSDPFADSSDEEDEILSNSEISAWSNGPLDSTRELQQDVVFYRKNGDLHFHALFDKSGPVEISLLKNGSVIGKIRWKLTSDPSIGNLLETVDSILAGTYDDPGGVILAAMQQGIEGEDLSALRVKSGTAGDIITAYPVSGLQP